MSLSDLPVEVVFILIKFPLYFHFISVQSRAGVLSRPSDSDSLLFIVAILVQNVGACFRINLISYNSLFISAFAALPNFRANEIFLFVAVQIVLCSVRPEDTATPSPILDIVEAVLRSQRPTSRVKVLSGEAREYFRLVAVRSSLKVKPNLIVYIFSFKAWPPLNS